MSSGNISVGFRLYAEAFTAGLDQRTARMPAALREAVRQAGDAAQKAAQARAPVKTGRLRRSITPTPGGGGLTGGLGVGPRGGPMYLYSKKEEARRGYMKAGRDAAETALAASAERLIAAVWEE